MLGQYKWRPISPKEQSLPGNLGMEINTGCIGSGVLMNGQDESKSQNKKLIEKKKLV